jgi:aryl-alcohol dehydrogenase-like predicted oxidoreductase
VRYRPLARTGLSVSAVSLGTVSLGVDYGIAIPGEFGRPRDGAATRLLRDALEQGITLFDTAPAYGDSEALLGRIIARDPRSIIATKVSSPDVQASLDASRRALGRETLDIVQIHNATREMIEDGGVVDALEAARQRGALRFIGASVYGEDAALAVIGAGRFDVLQVALNVLDQRMVSKVLPAAAAAGVAVLVRSAYLKGVLTPKAQWLPDALAPLRTAAMRTRDVLARGRWDGLPAAAMRFCLSVPHVASVLTGACTSAELNAAIAAETAGPFDAACIAEAAGLAIEDDRLLNPSYWPVL